MTGDGRAETLNVLQGEKQGHARQNCPPPPQCQSQRLSDALGQLLFKVSFSFYFPFLRLHCILYIFKKLNVAKERCRLTRRV